MFTFLNNLISREYAPIWAICSTTIVFITYYRWPGRRLDHIPTVGSRSQILSLIEAFDFVFNARAVVQRGCERYRIFRVPFYDRWMVVVHGSEFVEQIRKAPEDELSQVDAVDESLQTVFTLGSSIGNNPYHIPLIRTQLTRNLDTLFPSLHEEISLAFDELIPAREDEWLKVQAMSKMIAIICRASNRIFVGAPLCRDPDYNELNITFTLAVIKAAERLLFTPRILKPFVASWFTKVSSSVQRAVKHLRPLIEERWRKMEELGKDYPDKPNDFLSWMMDVAQGETASVLDLTRRILTVNLGAIHTSTMTFTHVLYYLAEHPEHAETLREEIQEIVSREGWTHAAILQMVKVDSFIRETQRLNSLGCLNMSRIVREPFTFSDGTYLPKGTHVSIAAYALHTREDSFPDPHSFQPFRFVDKTKKENAGRKVDMTSTQPDFVAFGYGRHACPGRFFAAAELKFMLAYIVMNYDVKLEGPHPPNKYAMTACIPNPTGEVLFRKRAAQDC